eukprot:1160443-Pelagomonas_calceolata.AAC.10
MVSHGNASQVHPSACTPPCRYYCVRNSMVHPRFKSLPPFHTFVYLGEDPKGNNERDPLAGNIDEELGHAWGLFPCPRDATLRQGPQCLQASEAKKKMQAAGSKRASTMSRCGFSCWRPVDFFL